MKKQKADFIITKYHIRGENLKEPICMAMVSDLHNQDPKQVLKALESVSPDLILVAGDTLERHEEGVNGMTYEKMEAWQGLKPRWRVVEHVVKFCNAIVKFFVGTPVRTAGSHYAYSFLRKAAQIAPVYLSVGNHEWYFLDEDYQIMKEAGIVLLDNRDVEVRVKGQTLLIGGLSTRYHLKWLSAFAKKTGYKILLCHHPEYYFRHIKGTARANFDLILSGHCHGGQWRIGGRGIFAPGQGLFPKYVHGKWAYPKKTGGYGWMVIGAGVSNTAAVPRFGNPRELVVIELNER